MLIIRFFFLFCLISQDLSHDTITHFLLLSVFCSALLPIFLAGIPTLSRTSIQFNQCIYSLSTTLLLLQPCLLLHFTLPLQISLSGFLGGVSLVLFPHACFTGAPLDDGRRRMFRQRVALWVWVSHLTSLGVFGFWILALRWHRIGF